MSVDLMLNLKSKLTTSSVINILSALNIPIKILCNTDVEIRTIGDIRKQRGPVFTFWEKNDYTSLPTKPENGICVLVNNNFTATDCGSSLVIQVEDPRHTFIKFLNFLSERELFIDEWLRPDASVKICSSADVHQSALIEPGVTIEAGAIISAGCVIKRGTTIGRNTTIRENSVIGIEGLNTYMSSSSELVRFPHLSGVTVGRNTIIGANVTIARGVLAPTLIGSCVNIGNLSNIGHGVTIDNDVWMSVCVLVGGHTTIGSGVTIGMGAIIRDNLFLGSNSNIGMGSVVVASVKENISVFGNPAKRVPRLNTGPNRGRV